MGEAARLPVGRGAMHACYQAVRECPCLGLDLCTARLKTCWTAWWCLVCMCFAVWFVGPCSSGHTVHCVHGLASKSLYAPTPPPPRPTPSIVSTKCVSPCAQRRGAGAAAVLFTRSACPRTESADFMLQRSQPRCARATGPTSCQLRSRRASTFDRRPAAPRPPCPRRSLSTLSCICHNLIEARSGTPGHASSPPRRQSSPSNRLSRFTRCRRARAAQSLPPSCSGGRAQRSGC